MQRLPSEPQRGHLEASRREGANKYVYAEHARNLLCTLLCEVIQTRRSCWIGRRSSSAISALRTHLWPGSRVLSPQRYLCIPSDLVAGTAPPPKTVAATFASSEPTPPTCDQEIAWPQWLGLKEKFRGMTEPGCVVAEQQHAVFGATRRHSTEVHHFNAQLCERILCSCTEIISAYLVPAQSASQ